LKLTPYLKNSHLSNPAPIENAMFYAQVHLPVFLQVCFLNILNPKPSQNFKLPPLHLCNCLITWMFKAP
jgi:hypothetical protein